MSFLQSRPRFGAGEIIFTIKHEMYACKKRHPEIKRLVTQFVKGRDNMETPISASELAESKKMAAEFTSLYEEASGNVGLRKLDDHPQDLVLAFLLDLEIGEHMIGRANNMINWVTASMVLDVAAHLEYEIQKYDNLNEERQWKALVFLLTDVFMNENPTIVDLARERSRKSAEEQVNKAKSKKRRIEKGVSFVEENKES